MTAFAFKKAYIMHIINLVGKAYIMQVDYKATLGTTVFKNIVIRNGKEHSHKLSRISNSSRSLFKKIIIFTNIRYFV